MVRKFTPKDATEVLPILKDVGLEDNLEVKGPAERGNRQPIPEKLVDVLVQQLRPTLRTQLAKRLIDIALGDNDRMSLEAIKEIYDRVEGRARQAVTAELASNVIIVNTLKDIFKEEKTLHTSSTVDGMFEVLEN